MINELRLGNLIQDKLNKTPYEVKANTVSGLSQYQAADEGLPLEPVPISINWLLKLGFKKLSDTHYFIDETIQIDIENMNYQLKFHSWFIRNVFWVHQLQNLVFALTSKELSVVANDG